MHPDLKEALLFPTRMVSAIARGVGRLLMEKLEDHMYAGNPYVDMTPEQRLEIEQSDLRKGVDNGS